MILIEKPLAHPSSTDIEASSRLHQKSDTRVLVGYNQRLKPNTQHFVHLAQNLGPRRATWLKLQHAGELDGILKAHFWMKSERDSYLAFTDQGGGSAGAQPRLNLFLYFAEVLDQGRVTEVAADIEWVSHEDGRYDRDSALSSHS